MFNKNRAKKTMSPIQPNYDDYLKNTLHIEDVNKLPKEQGEFCNIIRKAFLDCDDFQFQFIPGDGTEGIYVYYFKAIADIEKLEQLLFLQNPFQLSDMERRVERNIHNSDYIKANNWKQCIQDCLDGNIILHLPESNPIIVKYRKTEKRNLTEPTTQYQVYGPKIGFIEDSRTNIALIRNMIKDPRLKLKEFTIGTLSHTHVGLLYLDEYVDPELLTLVTERLENLEMEQLNDSGELAKSIVDFPLSIFPQVYETERPDFASVALSQGKLVVVIDNSTFCLVLPITLLNLIEISPDNYRMPLDNTFTRFLRIISILVATILPALYVALVGYHPELLPTTLALSIAESRNNIPFPVYLEALMMIFALDILVEASIRLPSFVGQTIGIVGGLVIGQAAVEAGLVSNTMIIVSALTAITSFTLPTWHLISSWRIARYFILFASSFLGLFGLAVGVAFLTFHLCNLKSFGKPYLSPFSPFNPKELLDVFFRLRNNKYSK